jgi:hypothetical protein
VQKFLGIIAGIPSQIAATLVGGSAQAYQIPALGSTGQLDPTMMPTGVGADTASLPATEALAAGAMVSVWSNSGVTSVRNADSSAPGKTCEGFVLAAVASGAQALVYFTGLNTSQTGLTPGALYYLGSVGAIVSTPPSTTGTVTQQVGIAISATELQFNPQAQINN